MNHTIKMLSNYHTSNLEKIPHDTADADSQNW